VSAILTTQIHPLYSRTIGAYANSCTRGIAKIMNANLYYELVNTCRRHCKENNVPPPRQVDITESYCKTTCLAYKTCPLFSKVEQRADNTGMQAEKTAQIAADLERDATQITSIEIGTLKLMLRQYARRVRQLRTGA
jgi:hypothetical protein